MKKPVWLSMMLCVLFVVIACSDRNTGPDPVNLSQTPESTSPDPKGDPAAVPPEPAELVFYSQTGDPENYFNDIYGDKLRKKFPHYTIMYIQRTGEGTNLKDMVANKTPFDFYFATVAGFLNEVLPFNIQYDMTDLLKKHNVDLSVIEPAAIEGFRNDVDGKIYGLPIHQNVMVNIYNRDLFDKFGLDQPRDGMTWDEVYDLSRQLTRTEEGRDYIGYAPLVGYLIRMNPYSTPNINKDTLTPTINSQEAWKSFTNKLIVEAIDAVGTLRDSIPTDAGKIIDKFAAGEQGMLIYLPALMVAYYDMFKDMDFEFASMPELTDQPGIGSQPYPIYLGITNMSKNKDAATEALKFMISDEAQGELAKNGYMPVVKSENVRNLYGAATKTPEKNWAAAFYNHIAPVPYKGPMDTAVLNIYNTYLTEVMYGKLDVNTALRQAEEIALKKIEEYMSSVDPSIFK